MKRFLLGISALLLTAVMGFAQPTVRSATYNGENSPRLQRASWFHHRNRYDRQHYKDHYKHKRENRHQRSHGDKRHEYRHDKRDHDRDNYQYRPYRGY